MTATQYLQAPKVNFFKPPKPTPKENNFVTHEVVTLVTREVVDTLSVYAQEGLISSRDITYFESLCNKDNDSLFDSYKKNGDLNVISDIFDKTTTLFSKLADKSLSQYQKGAAPLLIEILKTIYGLRYIREVSLPLSLSVGKLPAKTPQEILSRKIADMEKLFMAEFSVVSNSKTFPFNQMDNVFRKMEKMNRKQYIEFLNNF